MILRKTKVDSTAHGSNAFLAYYLLHFLIWETLAEPIYGLFAVFFGLLPDFDSLFFILKGKDPRDNTFQHHLYFGSHWPITYVPLILITTVSFIFNFYPKMFLVPTVGIYAHMIC